MKLKRFHRPVSPRRGVAMLLVLVALAAATIMSTAYLASRDNSAAIGSNSAFTTEARWASLSGIELAVAIMQTETEWRTAHIDGKILDDYPIGGGTMDIDVLDLETGMPPTASTVHLRITSSATVEGLTQVSSATAFVMPVDGECAHVDLSEFAIYSGTTIGLADTATVTRWTSAPTGDLGRRINVGALGTNASTINLTGSSAIIDPSVYLTDTASALALTASSDQGAQRWDLASPLPMPAPPTAPTTAERPNTVVEIVAPRTVSGDTELKSATVTTSGVLTITGTSSVIVTEDLFLSNGGAIVIDGNVTISVEGDITMASLSSIELTPDSTLTLFVGGGFRVRDSYIGSARPDTEGFDTTGDAHYAAPSRLQIYQGSGSQDAWSFDGTSVIKATVYAPNKGLSISDTSAVYGRVAGSSVNLSGEGALFYDHALASPFGYTNPYSPVWSNEGSLEPAVSNLATLGSTDLQTLSDALGVPVDAGDITVDPVDPPPAPIGEIDGDLTTPRTVSVDYEVTAFGTDPVSWEERAVVHAEVDSGTMETKSDNDVATETSKLATLALEIPLRKYLGDTADARTSTQAGFVTRLDGIRTAVDTGQYEDAIKLSWHVLTRIDGLSWPEQDIVEECSEKKTIARGVKEILAQLYKKTDESTYTQLTADSMTSSDGEKAYYDLMEAVKAK